MYLLQHEKMRPFFEHPLFVTLGKKKVIKQQISGFFPFFG
jgi:hypothetical protein